MALSTCSKVGLYMHSKKTIPVSISECAWWISWEGWTMCSAYTDNLWKNHHTQLSPSTSTQHIWNLFQNTYFCYAGLWIDRAWGHNFDGYSGSSAERMSTVFSSTLYQCFQRQPTEHIDRVSSGPYENPGMWILKSLQSISLQRCWTFAFFKKTALLQRHPMCHRLRKPCCKVMAFSY